MLKYVLLASAMTISVPALAQDKPIDSQTAPTSQTAPAQTMPAPTDPAQAQPATTADPAAVTPSSPTTAVNPAAPQSAQVAQPASKTEQIAQVVDSEFPTYDKDSNGALSKTEFAAWMVALKKASDPTTKAEAPATKTWVAQAFTQADKDKSKSVTKTELEGFLAQS